MSGRKAKRSRVRKLKTESSENKTKKPLHMLPFHAVQVISMKGKVFGEEWTYK